MGVAEFQFTPLREGRLIQHLMDKLGGDISIHAPPRGATAPAPDNTQVQFISIHAPPRGATENHR